MSASPQVTGFGDPEQDVLLAALEAAQLPVGATVPAWALEVAVQGVLEVIRAHEAAAADTELGEDVRSDARTAALAGRAAVAPIQRLLARA